MEYNFQDIEPKWRKIWADNKTFKAEDNSAKPKYYVLDMFPYPSGAGLHVGHPLGYIASDIYARYKRLQGFNVLHPMGYDSFGLPAEQYAIQTGQHPSDTTSINIDGCLDENGNILKKYINSDGSIINGVLLDKNIPTSIHDENYRDNIIKGYRDQLDKIGFSFDWDREVRTSSPEYYKWTQWIFKQLFDCYYDNKTDKAERISKLVTEFEANGNANVDACSDCETIFSAEEWNAFDEKEKDATLQAYRLTFLADSWVNWCPALGTVLANDEIVNGVSERGGHAVEQKLMRQWSMRIKAYAERLLTGLEGLDWTDSVKDIQRNWIGKSVGSSVTFPLWRGTEGEDNSGLSIEVFTTRPDTIFGVSFMVLAPEHPLVDQITTPEFADKIAEYKKSASLKSARDREADVKNITGQNTGAFVIHPFTGEKIQIWIGDYVLVSYGTGAVMAVPCGDQRDYDFAKHFGIEIKNIFENIDISEAAYTEKSGTIANADFLNGLDVKSAMKKAIEAIEAKGIGTGKTNYRLRDAVFSRQRYWGEPFPIYYQDGLPKMIHTRDLPIELPEVEKYLPTEDGKPPLGNAHQWAWDTVDNQIVDTVNIDNETVFPIELNTMPGWAGSSWYFLRYMDPNNESEFVSKEKADYWKNVDLYIGGSEHATGHLLYARFWTKFLYDQGFVSFDEPFQKMINQGMILGRSAIAYIGSDEKLYSFDIIKDHSNIEFREVRILIDLINDDESIIIDELRNWQPQFEKIDLITNNDGKIIVKREVDKMSKRWYNVVTPDVLCEKFGADTLRMYEMFLGPLEQFKPWDTKGITGVHNFLRKLWRLFHDKEGNLVLSSDVPQKESLKTLHKTIKKLEDDLNRFSFNTGVSNFMICVNELTEQKCNNRSILQELVVLLSPYAPHIAEELWEKIGNDKGTISFASFPKFDESVLVEANFEYPVSFNGKMRFKVSLPLALSVQEVEKEVMSSAEALKYLEGKDPKKVIVVPGRIVNVVL